MIHKSKTCKIGYSPRLIYQLVAHISDEKILYNIKSFFDNKGHIVYTKDKNLVYSRIDKFSDILEVVIPHFSKYPLQSVNKLF